MIDMKSGNSKYDREALQRLYRERFGKRSAYRDKVWQVLVADFFQEFVRSGDTVLDLGAGYGEFINHIHSAKKYAMDLNPDTPQKVQNNVEVITQDCSHPWPLQDATLDIVFSSNFFEHLPDRGAFR